MMHSIRQLRGVEYVPLEWYKYGQRSQNYNTTSGVLTNVPEIVVALRKARDSLIKRKCENPTSQGDISSGIFTDIVKALCYKECVKTKSKQELHQSF